MNTDRYEQPTGREAAGRLAGAIPQDMPRVAATAEPGQPTGREAAGRLAGAIPQDMPRVAATAEPGQPTGRERGSATSEVGQPRSGSRTSVAATRLQGRGAADRLEQLRELDGQIMQNADDLTRRIQRREKSAALSVIANLLRSMFERRAYLLGELNKAGISEAEAYREIKKHEVECRAADKEGARQRD